MGHTLTLGENEERAAHTAIQVADFYGQKIDVEELASIAIYAVALGLSGALSPNVTWATAVAMMRDPNGEATHRVIRELEAWAKRTYGVIPYEPNANSPNQGR